MDRNITGHVILTTFFFLLFLVIAVLLEKRKRPIQTFPGEEIPLWVKNFKDTVIKSLAAAGFILFSRKLISYVPLIGVMQTKSSLWWLDGRAVGFLAGCAVILILVLSGLLKSKLSIKEITGGCFPILIFLLIMAFFLLLKIKDTTIMGYFLLAFFSPLVLLKLLCSGKYLGFLISFILGCFIIAGYKKKFSRSREQDTATNVGITLTTIIILLVTLSHFIFGNFLGHWQGRFQRSVQSVKSEYDVEELLDIVNSIIDSSDKAIALKSLAAAGNIQWGKKTCRRVVRTAMTLKSSKESSSILKELALTAAQTGDIHRAISMAENIPVKEIRNNVLNELQEKIEKK